MASGDKIYLADKQTLDTVKNNVGATGDTGGTASAGSVFGKLNAIISWLTGTLWTAVQSIYNNAIAAVNNIATVDTKVTALQSAVPESFKALGNAKRIAVSVQAVGTYTPINLNGSGEVYFFTGGVAMFNTSYITSMTLIIDGVRVPVQTLPSTSSIGKKWGFRWDYFDRFLVPADTISDFIPITFKRSLKVEIVVKSAINTAEEGTLTAFYKMYE